MPDNNNEEILFPDLPICDPHQHFFYLPEIKYTPDDLINDISSGHNIVRTVYIDCKTGYRETGPEHLKPVGETEFIENLISCYKNPQSVKLAQGIVGFADLKLGDKVEAVLEAHLKASPARFRGIRNVAAWDGDPAFSWGYNAPHSELLLDNNFRKGFAYLRKYNLNFEAMIFHPQLPELADLAKTFPDTVIILDHTGVPLGIGPYSNKQQEVFDTWKKGIAEISRLKNVVLKIGGFGMDISAYSLGNKPKPITTAELVKVIKPYVMWSLECFGVERCMFESNFPVDRLALSYTTLWNAFKLLTREFSVTERNALFHDNAVRAYRLTV